MLHSPEPLDLCEGEKKALSVAQLGLPAVGICGIEGWHLAGTRDLHPDLDDVGLRGRIVTLIPAPMCGQIPRCTGRSSVLWRRCRPAAWPR